MFLQTLDAELAAINIGARMPAAGNNLAGFVNAKFDRTAGRAIIAGGVFPLLYLLGSNDNWFAVGTAKQHETPWNSNTSIRLRAIIKPTLQMPGCLDKSGLFNPGSRTCAPKAPLIRHFRCNMVRNNPMFKI
jgi:hypothetical protein